MSVSKEEFKSALSRFASGVTVVTTKDRSGNLFGITVSAFCSVSLEPPMVLICIDKKTGSHHAFIETGAFVVNFLREDQSMLSQHFASPSSDKFLSVEHYVNVRGLPVLSNALAVLECRLVHSYDGGDHTIFVGEVEKTKVSEGNPLIYFRGKYCQIED
ncbi:MAG: flavin reductase family protein [Pyrinomonadaceae bacterium]|nr:flavin reductase family protein [Pyrinomonadaceae bacterium]MCX7640355.1 flavin reductase family protein [Pyrinomonadaceae bacterium]MDW8304783.1 flavin reductase family protein [Acidobacteriota bacterium]